VPESVFSVYAICDKEHIISLKKSCLSYFYF